MKNSLFHIKNIQKTYKKERPIYLLTVFICHYMVIDLIDNYILNFLYKRKTNKEKFVKSMKNQ